MLPFLQKRQQTGVIVQKMKPEGGLDANSESSKDAGLEAAATDMLRALEAKDPKKLASALRAAIEILDAESSEESEPASEESYSE